MEPTTNQGQNSENKKVDIQDVIINSPVVSLFLLGVSVQIPTDVLKGILEEYVNRNGAIKSDSFFVAERKCEFCILNNPDDYFNEGEIIIFPSDKYVKGWKYEDYIDNGFGKIKDSVAYQERINRVNNAQGF